MTRFAGEVKPFLEEYCIGCHNAEKMKSGVRLDQLDGQRPESTLRLWEHVSRLVDEREMPPEDEAQPSEKERARLLDWIGAGLHEARSRDVSRDGTIRRLTVSQYRNTLRRLLGLDDDLTDFLPPEAVSRDGFKNNKDSMLLSPLLLETYFEIARQALDRCLVDETSKPTIQNFRMDLGRDINPQPLPEKLILGASSHLLRNRDFTVTELTPRKRFPFDAFEMQTQFRFVEGYQGNSTVRGWREYDSIYHAVYACMRGSGGYPLGNAYDLVPEGLLLRPAIPSAELFQVESTYGPKANFKVALRELPDQGRFRVTVRAARYDDGLMLPEGTAAIGSGQIGPGPWRQRRQIEIKEPGVYQVELYRDPPPGGSVAPDDRRIAEGRIGAWDFEDSPVASPFGRALSVSQEGGVLEVPRSEVPLIGDADFSVALWIHPKERQAGGMVASGPSERQGWILEMPDQRGGLRFVAHRAYQESSGSIVTKPGIIRKGVWQHVAVVVRRGEGGARLFVNGYQVGEGHVSADGFDHPKFGLHVGGVPNGNRFLGEIDQLRLYRRALEPAEVQALVEPGREWAQPPSDGRQPLSVHLGDRTFSGDYLGAPFVTVRLPAGPLTVGVEYGGTWTIGKIIFAPLPDPDPFQRFENRSPILGVHFGLRRDCGHTLNPVEAPRLVSSEGLRDYVFEGAIQNFPSPDVEKDNVNYISGLREIGVRSEYTDGRPRPRLLVRSIEFEGPLYETWPPKTHRRIFTSREPHSVIRDFAVRAFRRPLSEKEETSFTQIYDASFAATQDRVQAVQDALTVVLTSPQFLFLIEESQGPESEALDEFELASKLSYFLWNGPPDQALLDLAAEGQLRSELTPQVDRMVMDARFAAFASAFVTQWLGLDKLTTVETSREHFPELTRDAKTQLRLEPIRFVEYLIRENMPLRHLIRSDFIIANEVVARYYGLGDQLESGFEFRPVRHGATHLGGILSQAGILAALTDGRESNPVKRGAWFARKIIDEPPADPPPNVPDLSEDHRHLSLREQLRRHRDQPGCAKCHEGIDPWGLPFEAFDAGGRWMGRQQVDASSTLPDRTRVEDLNGLRTYLVEERLPQVAFSFLRHLATYAVGRNLKYNEVEFLREEAVDLEESGYRMRDLVRFLIQSDIFLKK